MKILEILQNLGISGKKKSSTEWSFPCPACGGSDRLTVWPEGSPKGLAYWCRQCGRRGDVAQALVDFCKVSKSEAMNQAGIETSTTTTTTKAHTLSPAWEPPESQPLKNLVNLALWRQKARAVVDWCALKLKESPENLEYLQGRGIRPDTAFRFKIGYMPGDEYRERGLFGLEDGKKLILPHGILIPCLDECGDVARIRFRRSEPGEFGRFYVLPGSDTRNFRTGLKMAKIALIVESELDAVLLEQEAGDLVSIIALGSSSEKPDGITHKILKDCQRILFSLDYDEAGKTAFAWWKSHYPQTIPHLPAIGKDPTEDYQKGVPLRDWVLSGLSSLLERQGPEPVENQPQNWCKLVEDAMRESENPEAGSRFVDLVMAYGEPETWSEETARGYIQAIRQKG